jgi:ribosomal protein S18 acetylase RimI-like enzyme
MNIEIATEVTTELTAALVTLIPQLSSSADPVTEDVLRRVLADPAITMFVAHHEGIIVGSLTLAVFTIPTGSRAWIEDVVVDESARGLGAGEALTLAALDAAKAKGATSVDLTSRPSREAANRLYLRMGFVARETNVYRFSLEG